ncbi:3-isopropylmalate dehydratase [Pseudomonas caricapapayae]|uniref:3-isopropylmalate dehydratase n=1 Tax=Pseudomonas caricapapayae TaxID=46678 RepID=A0A3M6FBN5_9PSED|nr:aconitase family protein [Pseudomonas caricapapayae]RMV78049.1 3-isopropylmalate dehydratase [Pseudomonas caricapapayae]
MHSDPDAVYADTIELDCDRIRPMIASPGDPGNGRQLNNLTDRVHVDIAYGGSCTAGKRDDFDHYFEVINWALEHELKLHPDVKLYLQFGTVDVRDYCEQKVIFRHSRLLVLNCYSLHAARVQTAAQARRPVRIRLQSAPSTVTFRGAPARDRYGWQVRQL